MSTIGDLFCPGIYITWKRASGSPPLIRGSELNPLKSDGMDIMGRIVNLVTITLTFGFSTALDPQLKVLPFSMMKQSYPIDMRFTVALCLLA
jgi:hypothetical protein